MKKAILGLLLTALTLFGADLAGKWQGKLVVEGADNDMLVTLNLKQDGASLTGTIMSDQGGAPIELKEAKVEGAKVTFDVPYRGQTFKFALTASGAEMNGSLKGATEDGSPVTGKVTIKKVQSARRGGRGPPHCYTVFV